MRAVWETIVGLVLVFGGFFFSALPLVALWLFVDEGDAVWGVVLLASLAVWVIGGVGAALWRRFI